jgi:glutamate-1-semialdehyde aminotransferase
MNASLKLWNEALLVIPDGNSFLSKNPSRFYKSNWPIYFSRSKGCEVWGINNKKYYDFSSMGVGTNVLGYGVRYIDNKVIKNIKLGNMTSLNCPEEVELAKKLLKIHPWADMVKYARTGGEGNAIAIRLARAFTKKNKIVICGYHGWHDWYLSENLKKKNYLETHLFKNLKTEGVPKILSKYCYSVLYNDIDRLKSIISKDKDIACFIMEVTRDKKPEKNYLNKIRKICNDNNIILIFDECTTGFRETYGGIHMKYKIYPDIAMFGKAIGNGYAITAILGKKKIMECSKNTFISSTFWSERIGPTAAIATLDYMKKHKSWIQIKKKGKYIKKQIIKIAEKNKLKINVSDLDSIIRFDFENIKNKNFFYKEFINEMLKRGFLASNFLYVSLSHTSKLIELYLRNFDETLKKINVSN